MRSVSFRRQQWVLYSLIKLHRGYGGHSRELLPLCASPYLRARENHNACLAFLLGKVCGGGIFPWGEIFPWESYFEINGV